MNPEDNNGNMDGGDSFGMGPIDFTSDSNNLSMSDSLASAQDNLMSAGMAAGDSGSGAMSLDQIGASDSSAFMARPNEPLIPAAPVPGSIGSVISGPALPSDDSAVPDAMVDNGMAGTTSMDTSASVNPAAMAAPVSAENTVAGAAFVPVADNPSVSAMEQYNSLGTNMVAANNNMPQSQAVANVTAPVSQNPTASPSVTPGIPFVTSQTPELVVDSPVASDGGDLTKMQTQMATPEIKPEKKASNSKALTIILGILVVVMLVLAVVFAVLWQVALGDNEQVYVAPPLVDDIQGLQNTTVSCTIDGVTEIDGFGQIPMKRKIDLNFTNDILQNASVSESLTFADAAAAEAARAYFDGKITALNEYATQTGMKALGANYAVNGNVVDWSAVGEAAQLTGRNTWEFSIVIDENEAVIPDRETILADYKGKSYTCEEYNN